MSKLMKWGIVYVFVLFVLYGGLLFLGNKNLIALPLSLASSLFFSLLPFIATALCMNMGYAKPRSKSYWIEVLGAYPFYVLVSYFLLRL